MLVLSREIICSFILGSNLSHRNGRYRHGLVVPPDDGPQPVSIRFHEYNNGERIPRREERHRNARCVRHKGKSVSEDGKSRIAEVGNSHAYERNERLEYILH